MIKLSCEPTELAHQLLEAYQAASEEGGAITITVKDVQVGISVPKGTSVVAIDRMVADACDRLDRKLGE
jgi:hypothetical protein